MRFGGVPRRDEPRSPRTLPTHEGQLVAGGGAPAARGPQRRRANSIGEVELALRAGFRSSDIVFSGVGKSQDEIERAVQLGLKAINAESAGELERIDRAAQARGVRARVAVRVNPDIDAGTHPHISTGLHINKFGVPLEQAGALYRRMATQPGLEPVGIHVHLGSQIISTEPLLRGASAVVRLARELRDGGIQLDHIDIGGGLGISYDGSRAPTAAEYAAAVLPIVASSGLSIALEPGRYIVGAAAALVARVVDLKDPPADIISPCSPPHDRAAAPLL